MLNFGLLNAILLSVIMLNVIMLSVAMLNVIMLSVMVQIIQLKKQIETNFKQRWGFSSNFLSENVDEKTSAKRFSRKAF
jgi:hypothetical protein